MIVGCIVYCIGCPLAGKKSRNLQFKLHPIYMKNYIRAFEKMIYNRKNKGLDCNWNCGIDVFHWWMNDGVLPKQISFDDIEN